MGVRGEVNPLLALTKESEGDANCQIISSMVHLSYM